MKLIENISHSIPKFLRITEIEMGEYAFLSTQIYEKTCNNDNNHTLKNSYQLVENINKLKNINNIVTYDFKDLFSNVNFRDLSNIINSLFQEYYTQLQLPDNINADYFKTLTNFIINNDYIIHNSKYIIRNQE